MHRHVALLCLVVSTSALGCGSSYALSPDDGGSGDGGSDATADATPDAGGPCEAGVAETTACGKCGTHTRVCNGDGRWSDFSACAG
jgi:hypothetical protein